MPDIFGREGKRPTVACDLVILMKTGSGARDFAVLLVRRGKDPYKDMWALPGGFMEWGESCEECAARELREETGVENVELGLLGVYSEPGRDPRGTIVSIGYIAIVDKRLAKNVTAGDDAADAKWFSIDEIPDLGFDHDRILGDAFEKINLQ